MMLQYSRVVAVQQRGRASSVTAYRTKLYEERQTGKRNAQMPQGQAPAVTAMAMFVLMLVMLTGLTAESTPPRGGRFVSANDGFLSDLQAEQQQFCQLLATQKAGICEDCTAVLLPVTAVSGAYQVNITVFAQGDIVDALRHFHTWDKHGIAEMRRAIREAPDGWVVDVGSQLGWFALSAAAQVHSFSTVVQAHIKRSTMTTELSRLSCLYLQT